MQFNGHLLHLQRFIMGCQHFLPSLSCQITPICNYVLLNADPSVDIGNFLGPSPCIQENLKLYVVSFIYLFIFYSTMKIF